jgi:hypothetical protein
MMYWQLLFHAFAASMLAEGNCKVVYAVHFVILPPLIHEQICYIKKHLKCHSNMFRYITYHLLEA